MRKNSPIACPITFQSILPGQAGPGVGSGLRPQREILSVQLHQRCICLAMSIARSRISFSKFEIKKRNLNCQDSQLAIKRTYAIKRQWYV